MILGFLGGRVAGFSGPFPRQAGEVSDPKP